MVSRGNVAADVGCDHGYVSIWLVENGVCPKVIAMDVRKGPLSAAKEHIRQRGLGAYIETRLSDGVAALLPGEADTLLTAGMGGRLVVKILEEGKEKIRQMSELVLQPQSELSLVRRYLREQGYTIAEEEMVLEDGKYYPMFRVLTQKGLSEAKLTSDAHGYAVFDRENSEGKDEGQDILRPEEETLKLYDTYGKLLLQSRHPVLYSFLGKEMQICSQIEDSIRHHAGHYAGHFALEGVKDRLEEVHERQKLLKEALACYSQDA